jgi:predicted benzoate:H+ symporter BenE
MDTCKKWYHSKTMWFNIVSAALVFTDGLSQLLSGLIDVIPSDIYPWVVFGITLVNLFLRTITTSGVEK